MIKVSEHRTDLMNLHVTLKAIEQLENLIDYYNIGQPGPAYLQIRHAMGEPNIQIDRAFMIDALENQRRKLIDYLADLGIDYEG